MKQKERKKKIDGFYFKTEFVLRFNIFKVNTLLSRKCIQYKERERVERISIIAICLVGSGIVISYLQKRIVKKIYNLKNVSKKCIA